MKTRGKAVFNVYYNHLVDGNNEVFWMTPDNDSSNSNQYVLGFRHTVDGKEKTDMLCIVGDWEYQAVLECLDQVSDVFIKKDINYQKTIHSESLPDTVTLSLLKKSDATKVRIRFEFHEQEPYEVGASWKGKKSSTFAFYRELDELPALGRIIQREAEEPGEPVFSSEKEDWFVRNALFPEIFGDRPVIPFHGLRENVVAHLKDMCPEHIRDMWIGFLDTLGPKTTIATCKECKNPFYQEARWKKVCYRCYTGFKMVNRPNQNADQIVPWLFSYTE